MSGKMDRGGVSGSAETGMDNQRFFRRRNFAIHLCQCERIQFSRQTAHCRSVRLQSDTVFVERLVAFDQTGLSGNFQFPRLSRLQISLLHISVAFFLPERKMIARVSDQDVFRSHILDSLAIRVSSKNDAQRIIITEVSGGELTNAFSFLF